MSNLWFFRLRPSEQKEQSRRRSSDEQSLASLGSGDLHGHLGGRFAQHLQQQQQPTIVTELIRTTPEECSAATAAGTSTAPEVPASRDCEDSQRELSDADNERDETAMSRSWQANKEAVASRHSRQRERQVSPKWTSHDCQEPLSSHKRPTTMTETTETATSSASAHNSVPQVTIIRSDSNVSQQRQDDEGVDYNSKSADRSSDVVGAAPATPTAKQLIAQLNGEAINNTIAGVSSFVVGSDGGGGVRQRRAAASATSGPCQSAAQTNSKGQLLREQLVSGKVPPISERSLLNPTHSAASVGGGGAGASAAAGRRSLGDSMDNLAALIPR